MEDGGQRVGPLLSREGRGAASWLTCPQYCSMLAAKVFGEEQRLSSPNFNTQICLSIGLPWSCHLGYASTQQHRVGISRV